MSLPGITSTILENGLGVSSPATSRPCVIGCAEDSPTIAVNTPTLVSGQSDLRTKFGTHGPLVDMIGRILDIAGGPVLACRATSSVAATYGGGSTEEMAPNGGSVSNDEGIDLAVATTEPKNDFDLVVTIVVGGARGTATFTYSLDAGETTSEVLTSGASVALGASGITLEFQAGSTTPFVAGDVYSSTVKGPHYNGTDLGNAHDALEASPLTFDFVAYAGEAADGSTAATDFATISTQMATFEAADRYYRAIMGGGDDTAANALSAHAALVGSRVCIAFGRLPLPAPISAVGRGLPKLPISYEIAARAANNVISTDLAQTSGASSVGAIVGAGTPTHDELLNYAGLDDVKVSTVRTYTNLAGIFLTNAWLKSGNGSDFQYWQHGRIMDVACATVSAQHTQLISSQVTVKTDGTGQLTEAAAQAIEKRVQRALDAVIGSATRGVGPTAIDGGAGHVSDIRYTVDRLTNVLSTSTLVATVAIVPKGYLKTLTATLSFKLQT